MDKSTTTTLINGVAADFLSVNDRSIHYGDGLFETILCEQNKLLYWQQHYQRLKQSAARLKLICPDEVLLLNDIKKIMQGYDNSINNIYAVKIIVTRGVSERGYQFSNKISPTRIVVSSLLDKAYSSLVAGKLFAGNLYVCKQQASINESLAGLKHLNRLENVLARNEWQDRVADNIIDGLMLDANQQVIEGSMSNVFIVRDKKLITPNLKYSGVDGIVRQLILDVAKRNNLATLVSDLTVDDFNCADECFITNSLIGMKLVTGLAEHKYKSSSITDLLFKELLKTKIEHAKVI